MANQPPCQENVMINNSVLMGGTYIMHTTKRDPLETLNKASSPSAFHDSGERYDPPKCHQNTRVAVLKKIMNWIIGCDAETRDKWIMWLSGGAGAGKSAIAQTIAERCYAEGRLLGSFFFGRSDVTRNHAKPLIPTIASQIYANFPATRNDISSVINNDPLIFNKSLLFQLMSFVIKPLKHLEDAVSHHLIIIDGLDECVDRASQVIILRTLFDAIQKHSCRIRFLVVSRPEHDIVTAFASEDVEVIPARLVLEDECQSYMDIKRFLTDKFKDIAKTHPFRKHIAEEWPESTVVEEIARKASGQFIFASVLIKYIESIRHRPDHRLEIVRNLRPRQGDSDLPFAELDALYTHILFSIENASLVVEILSFIIHETRSHSLSMLVVPTLTADKIEEIHDLEPGSLQILFCDIGALVSVVHDYLGQSIIQVLHASILDFLIDPSRSKHLHIPASLLITKHVTRCLRVLSKNGHSRSTRIIVEFLINYCKHVMFTADMACAFEEFSLLKLLQNNASRDPVNLAFLIQLNPILLDLIRQSDEHQFLLRYTNMLDETYITLLDTYPEEYLALHLASTIIHPNSFPNRALEKCFQLELSQSLPEHDHMWISQKFYYDIMFHGAHADDTRALLKEYRVALCKFLLDPVRSGHHTFGQSSAGKMYAKSLLACFSYLNTQLFLYDSCRHCPIDRLIPLNKEERKEHTDTVFHNTPICYATNNKWEEWDQTTREAWDKNYSYSPENVDIVDTDKDIQAWFAKWNEVIFEDRQWRYSTCPSLDTRSKPLLKRFSSSYFDPISLWRTWVGRYGLMLGYMIYFFPRASKSQKLIKLCKTTILPRDKTLFPEDTVRAQRAMTAYLKRVEGFEDVE